MKPALDPSARLAAVDLGSNSFHLLIARWENQRLHVLDKRKEMVRLAAGLDADRNLSIEKQEEALATLKRMGELLKGIPDSNKRAVGTNTLRAARDADRFVERASEALGCSIDVIAGKEEARLVYIGVSHSVQPAPGRQLVVDIGGGSTECIIGHGFEPELCHSLRMGCVTFTQGFFPCGVIKKDRMNAALFAAGNEVSSIQQDFLDAGFVAALGSSGTAGAISDVAREQGWTDGVITKDVLRKLQKQLTTAGHVDKLKLAGLSEPRRAVLPGGVAILSAVFERLHVDAMSHTDGALRDGVLYDLIGRRGVDDVRDRTVAALQARYGVSTAQAHRVERRLDSFLDQVGETWGNDGEHYRQLARWAAALHELGLVVSYAGHHRHGAYLVEHSDLAGFSRSEQRVLAALLLCHRRKFRYEAFANIPGASERNLVRLAILLRLAVHVERMRTDDPSPSCRLQVDGRKIKLLIGARSEDYPLLAADLEAEAEALARAKFELSFERERPLDHSSSIV
jgi:exopolyphosphatase / guanosine-5'-triphosphate,3'-diphosphate pyrophosphatase